MASQSVYTVRFPTPIGFFEAVDRGDPLTKIHTVQQFADHLLSFGSGKHVLHFGDDLPFYYVYEKGTEGWSQTTLKAVLCFALLVAPFARLFHAFWTKSPIHAGLVAPMVIPLAIFWAKLNFRSNLTSTPLRQFLNQKKSLITQYGIFRNKVLREGICIAESSDKKRQVWKGLFSDESRIDSGIYQDRDQSISYVNPRVIREGKKLNFLRFRDEIKVGESKSYVPKPGGFARIYKKSPFSPIEALFEIAKDSSSSSPIRRLALLPSPIFQASEVIEYLTSTEREGLPPRFTQLSNQSLLEFIQLVDAQKELPETPRRQILAGIPSLLSEDLGRDNAKLLEKLGSLRKRLSLEELDEVIEKD